MLVTGASGGIGRAVCTLLLEQGHKVTGVDSVPLLGAPWHQVRADLSQEGAAYRAGNAARDFGSVTHLVHCAAVQVLGAAGQVTDDVWLASLRVNVLALDELVRACAEDLRHARGAIVAITSVHSAATTRGMAAYATSKAALQGWVRAAALDLAPEIRVNAVQPGAVRTSMLTAGMARRPSAGTESESLQVLASKTPLNLVADPEDIADVVCFLLGPASRYITGSTLTADGGALLRLATE